MPKGGKPYSSKSKKPGRMLCQVLGLWLFASPVLAGPLTWSEQPLHFTWDHVGANTGSSIEERGVTAWEAMYGSLMTLKLGANTFEVLLLSAGLGATGEVGTQSTAFDGQFGLVWICTTDRGVCLEFPKVARAPTAIDNDNRYLVGVTVRPSALLAPSGAGVPQSVGVK